jgi:hypothetical protein
MNNIAGQRELAHLLITCGGFLVAVYVARDVWHRWRSRRLHPSHRHVHVSIPLAESTGQASHVDRPYDWAEES